MPINFLHRSASEQRNIIYSYIGYLKIAPPELQIKSISKKADIGLYVEAVKQDIEAEPDGRCRMLQKDYIKLLRSVGYREAVTRRFFLVFSVDSRRGTESEIAATLNSYAQTAKKYLYQCGNEVVISDNPTQDTVEMLYLLLNRKTSTTVSLSQRLNQVAAWYIRENGEESTGRIPVAEYFAPESLDFRHGNYVIMDGVYHTYLFVPSARYRNRVPAGWLSLLVNAGEGIDVDLFLYKQDKVKTIERIGRRIRLNRSKIKDASDTNTDFDDLAESIQSGYYLKNGLAANEEFYYIAVQEDGPLKAGDYIVKPDSQERFQVGSTRALKGVFNINKGYTVFKEIEILDSNNEYYTIKKGASYGLSVYDHIVLDASLVTEGQILYQ